MEDIRIHQVRKYVDVRTEQLKKEMELVTDEMDRAWYQRLIKELEYCKFWVREKRKTS